METHRLVITEDLNQYGMLFGGRILSWVDEASFIAATLDYPDCRFITIGMDNVEFRHSVGNGTIISIKSTWLKQGNTSATYKVDVLRGRHQDGNVIFTTNVTFVNVDEQGMKQPIKGKAKSVSQS